VQSYRRAADLARPGAGVVGAFLELRG
jgi:hypothetical protein